MSEYDKSPLDLRNVIGVVVGKEGDMYKLATNSGILPKVFARNQFQPCQSSHHMTVNDVPSNSTTIRGSVSADSVFHGQGFISCDCRQGCNSKRGGAIQGAILFALCTRLFPLLIGGFDFATLLSRVANVCPNSEYHQLLLRTYINVYLIKSTNILFANNVYDIF